MISHQPQNPQRLPSFHSTLQSLLSKQQHINTSLSKLRECKNITFTKLKQQLSEKDLQIKKLIGEKEKDRARIREICKQKEDIESKYRKTLEENEGLKFQLERERRKGEGLKREIGEVEQGRKQTERKYREQVRRLEEDLMWTKLKGTEGVSKRRGSLTHKTGVNLSKAFEDQTTHLSFIEESFSRK